MATQNESFHVRWHTYRQGTADWWAATAGAVRQPACAVTEARSGAPNGSTTRARANLLQPPHTSIPDQTTQLPSSTNNSCTRPQERHVPLQRPYYWYCTHAAVRMGAWFCIADSPLPLCRGIRCWGTQAADAHATHRGWTSGAPCPPRTLQFPAGPRSDNTFQPPGRPPLRW